MESKLILRTRDAKEIKREQSMSEEIKILVVEDSPTARQYLTDIISDAGYQVFTAEDGEKALELVHQHHPEVVVLDIVLPKKNGYQVCRTIKADPELAIKILMVTAKDQERDRIWGHRQGADSYLSKPVIAKDLLTAIDELVVTADA